MAHIFNGRTLGRFILFLRPRRRARPCLTSGAASAPLSENPAREDAGAEEIALPETSLLSRAKIFIEAADAAAGQRQLERVLERDADGALAAVLAERPPARLTGFVVR